MSTSQSIYATPAPASVCRTRAARTARRARTQQRLTPAVEGPPHRLDRLGPLQEALRTYRARGLVHDSPLKALRHRVEDEVRALEQWAESRPTEAQKTGATIRRALELLRSFGRLTVLDFTSVPEEDRPHLVALLALEHRWCYACAGTTRAAFKAAAGRTGAR